MHFDDITLIPADFSTIESRKDVSPAQVISGVKLNIPIISSNMDTVYSPELSRQTLLAGGMSVVHRFCSIEENVNLFLDGRVTATGDEVLSPWVSVGVSDKELDRAQALVEAGAEVLVLDVANAASVSAVRQFRRLKELFKVKIVVGNFATKEQIIAFNREAGTTADAYKIGIGSGSACATEDTVTGVGLKHIDTILSCVESGFPVIMDGGIGKPSDFCKSLALGCVGVMMGRPFAACEESGGDKLYKGLPKEKYLADHIPYKLVGGVMIKDFESYPMSKPSHSKYRGSAAASSYEAQGKTASFRAPEGREELIEVSGTVSDMLRYYEASLRSSMTYLNAMNLNEYRTNAKWRVK